jgi:hypothetical protein
MSPPSLYLPKSVGARDGQSHELHALKSTMERGDLGLARRTSIDAILQREPEVETPIEFGHKVFLTESARRLITQYKVLDGIPSTNSTWLFRWNATSRPSVTSPNCIDQIAVSSVKRT